MTIRMAQRALTKMVVTGIALVYADDILTTLATWDHYDLLIKEGRKLDAFLYHPWLYLRHGGKVIEPPRRRAEKAARTRPR